MRREGALAQSAHFQLTLLLSKGALREGPAVDFWSLVIALLDISHLTSDWMGRLYHKMGLLPHWALWS